MEPEEGRAGNPPGPQSHHTCAQNELQTTENLTSLHVGYNQGFLADLLMCSVCILSAHMKGC